MWQQESKGSIGEGKDAQAASGAGGVVTGLALANSPYIGRVQTSAIADPLGQATFSVQGLNTLFVVCRHLPADHFQFIRDTQQFKQFNVTSKYLNCFQPIWNFGDALLCYANTTAAG